MAEAEDQVSLGTYAVYTTGGDKLTIKASNFVLKPEDNRVYFKNVDEEEEGHWTFFLNGIAAIHRMPGKPIKDEGGSFSYQSY